MLIYRIEDINGDGLYRGTLSNPMRFDESRHPLPMEDSKMKQAVMDMAEMSEYTSWNFDDNKKVNDVLRPYIFGFSSIDQLRNWIYEDEWLSDMADIGFFLSVFNVDPEHVVEGYTQAVFIRAEAKEVAQYSIREFFNL